MRVLRYELKVIGEQTLDLLMGTKILSVAPGRGGVGDYHIDLWAAVPEEAPVLPVTIQIYGTGHPMTTATRLDFIGTAVMYDGLVWHVFRDTEKRR